MVPFLAAALATAPFPNARQAAAAASMGITHAVHFDLGRRPSLRTMGGMDPTTQPVVTMSNHGGPVQLTTSAYLIWWLPSGATLPANYQHVVERYFDDMGGSALYGIIATYAGSNGRASDVESLGGEWTDTTAYPATIGGKSVEQALARAIAANPSWPLGLGSQFYVLTASNAKVASSQFCAYHSFVTNGGQDEIFAYIPDPAQVDGCQTPFDVSPNQDIDVDSATTSINHEQAEMATDPLIDTWYDDSTVPALNGAEVADVCIFDFGIPLRADGANVVFANGDEFVAQEIFDNKTGICAPTL